MHELIYEINFMVENISDKNDRYCYQLSLHSMINYAEFYSSKLLVNYH